MVNKSNFPHRAFISPAIEAIFGSEISWAKAYLDKELAIVSHAIAAGGLVDACSGTVDPLRFADSYRAKVYSRALLGEPYEYGDLRLAASELVSFANISASRSDESTSVDNDSIGQQLHLDAVRLMLIAGQVSDAHELLLVDCSFKFDRAQFEAIRELTDDLSAAAAARRVYPAPPIPCLAGWFRFFDTIRDVRHVMHPATRFTGASFRRTPLFLFEVGLITYRYFCSPDETIDWYKAADLASH